MAGRNAVTGAVIALAALVVVAPWLHDGALQAQGTQAAHRDSPRRSVRIATLPWTEAERLLDTSTVVMIPLDAEAKEHGLTCPSTTIG